MASDPRSSELDARNAKTARLVFAVVGAMVLLAFASVPLYRIFCSVTGFGGPASMLAAAPDPTQIVSDRIVSIQFATNVDGDLDWSFRPEKRRVDIAVGQQGLMSFDVQSHEQKQSIGTAIYNVTPEKAGRYFKKTQCFCFDGQTLEPGAAARFPIVFYVDPAFADDAAMNDVREITLSYTYYRTDSRKMNDAMDRFFSATQ